MIDPKYLPRRRSRYHLGAGNLYISGQPYVTQVYLEFDARHLPAQYVGPKANLFRTDYATVVSLQKEGEGVCIGVAFKSREDINDVQLGVALAAERALSIVPALARADLGRYVIKERLLSRLFQRGADLW